MKKQNIHKTFICGMGMLMLLSVNFAIAGEFITHGDFSLISAYIWRGIRQFEGCAVQGMVSCNWSFLSFGIWYSGGSFGNGTLMETDPYFGISLSKESLSGEIGMICYSYDFNKWNDYADQEIELFAKGSVPQIDISVYYVPKQKSTEEDPKPSNYWIELSFKINKMKLDWDVEIGYGTYSSRYLETQKKMQSVI